MSDYTPEHSTTSVDLLLAEATAWADQQRGNADVVADQLHTNRRIGIALGLIMAQHKVSDTQARDVLEHLARDAGMPVATVAHTIVAEQSRVALGAAVFLAPAALAS
jgi:AmiR/NasT family two-component response regulator